MAVLASAQQDSSSRLALAIYAALAPSPQREVEGIAGFVGLALLGVCAVGAVGAGLFTTDPLDSVTLTTGGTIHAIGSVIQLALFPFAALLVMLSLRRGSLGRLKFVVAAWPATAFIGFMIHLSVYVLPLDVQFGPNVPLGWPVRIVLLAYAVWVVTIGVKLLNSKPKRFECKEI